MLLSYFYSSTTNEIQFQFLATTETCFIKSSNVNGLLSNMSPSMKSIVYPASIATKANQASSHTDPSGPNSHVILRSTSNYIQNEHKQLLNANNLKRDYKQHLKCNIIFHELQIFVHTFVTTKDPFIPNKGLFINLNAVLCFPISSATLIESATVHKRF